MGHELTRRSTLGSLAALTGIGPAALAAAAVDGATPIEAIDSVAALRRRRAPLAPAVMLALGYHVAGGGGGGAFLWSPNSHATDDGGLVLRPSERGADVAGRWLRLVDGPIDVRWFGAIGDGVADDSAAIQRAIDATRSSGVLVFSRGRYRVSSLDAGRGETNWRFDGAELVGGATRPTDCILRVRGLHSRFTGLRIDGGFNDKYACALWWYEADGPSQHIDIHGLEIRYARRGIVYGALPGRSSTGFAQSENTIFGYRTRGVERPLFVNHANGVLTLSAPQLVAHDEEWARDRPGAFDNRANHAFEAIAGVLTIDGGEVQNSIAAPASACAVVDGGEVYLNGCIIEVSAPFRVHGRLTVRGGRILNTQSLTGQFVLAGGGTDTVLDMAGCRLFRNRGTGAFSDRSLVTAPNEAASVRIAFDHCEITDWARFAPLVTGVARHASFDRCVWHPDGSRPERFRLDTDAPDLLEGRGIDRAVRTLAGFFHDHAQTRAARIVADVPTPGFERSIAVGGRGLNGLFTVDASSLATAATTGVTVRGGDAFVVEGWVRRAGGRVVALSMLLLDTTGRPVAAGADGPLVVCGPYQDFIADEWRYLRQIVVVPSGPAALAGFGGHARDGELRFCGLQVRRADLR